MNIYTSCVEPLNMQFARQITYLVDRNCQIFFIKMFHSCSCSYKLLNCSEQQASRQPERVNVAKYLSGDRHTVWCGDILWCETERCANLQYFSCELKTCINYRYFVVQWKPGIE